LYLMSRYIKDCKFEVNNCEEEQLVASHAFFLFHLFLSMSFLSSSWPDLDS
jgi:hypothetical protein